MIISVRGGSFFIMSFLSRIIPLMATPRADAKGEQAGGVNGLRSDGEAFIMPIRATPITRLISERPKTRST